MNHNNTIQQITLTGVLTALAVLIGAFAHFPLFGQQVYLVGAIVFMMPVALKFRYSLIGVITSIVLTDLITGWIQYTWISIIAYVIATIIIWVFSLIKLKMVFIPGLVIGSVAAIAIYFFLELSVLDKGIAIDGLLTNLVQFAIVIPLASLIYLPVKLISLKYK